jgi:prepilin-type N-terminal cleavage/methylation domain-containing protein
MRGASRKSPQLGFTLIELLTALGIFLVICGAAFTLLAASQQHAQTESQVLTSFQEARLGLDQIVRDVNSAGYPPRTFFDSNNPPASANTPFAWSAGYPAPCTIGGSCATSPGDFDLIVETNSQDPGSPVQWIRYQLNGTTLLRGVAQKQIGNDPAADSAIFFAPFVQNVVNNDTAQIATYQTAYPSMFPGGNPVPMFVYTCDTGGVPASCAGNSPANIRDVIVTLIVKAPTPDATTGRIRLVQLIGRGRRVNPNQ